MTKKHLHVACAIIRRDGKILAAQRSASMSLPLKWEFPGGKIKQSETAAECLARELHEELGVKVSVGKSGETVTHNYPDFVVSLYPFECTIVSGEIHLHEHAAMAWMAPEELHLLDWAEADLPIIERLQKIV
jgi:8-oxo-dGTP diphosphatase